MKVFATAEAINIEEPSLFPNSSLQNQGADDVQDVDDFQDAMLHDLYENATEVSKILFHKYGSLFPVLFVEVHE